MTRLKLLLSTLSLLLAASAGLRGEGPAISFQEIRDLLKTNLVNADSTQLDRAAAEGLLSQVSPRALLLTNGRRRAGPGPLDRL